MLLSLPYELLEYISTFLSIPDLYNLSISIECVDTATRKRLIIDRIRIVYKAGFNILPRLSTNILCIILMTNHNYNNTLHAYTEIIKSVKCSISWCEYILCWPHYNNNTIAFKTNYLALFTKAIDNNWLAVIEFMKCNSSFSNNLINLEELALVLYTMRNIMIRGKNTEPINHNISLLLSIIFDNYMIRMNELDQLQIECAIKPESVTCMEEKSQFIFINYEYLLIRSLFGIYDIIAEQELDFYPNHIFIYQFVERFGVNYKLSSGKTLLELVVEQRSICDIYDNKELFIFLLKKGADISLLEESMQKILRLIAWNRVLEQPIELNQMLQELLNY